jgi:gas vesicle protein
MRKAFGFLIGIFVGGLVGGTIALLLAPKSGEDLRGQIRQRGAGFFAEVKSAADARRLELEEELTRLRSPRIPLKD